MNAHDTNNLLYLMSLPTQHLEQWFLDATEDDRLYAEELLAEAHLAAIDATVANMPQFNEAQQVLNKFKL